MSTVPTFENRTPARASVSRLDRAGIDRARVSWPAACVIADALMLAAALVTAEIGAPGAGVPRTPPAWLAAFALAVLGAMWIRGAYRPRLRLQVLDDIRTIVAATAIAAMTVISLRVVFSDEPYVAAEAIRQWAFATFYLAAGRTGLFAAQTRARRAGEAGRPTLIVGAGRVGQLVARRLMDHPEFGLRPVGFLDKEPLIDVDEQLGVPVVGASWDLEPVVRANRIEQVVLAFSTAPHHVFLDLVRRCERLGVGVSQVPRLFENVTDQVRIEHIGGIPLLSVERADPKGWQFELKYAIDRVVAGFLLLLALPVLLLAGLAVWSTMGRPILHGQPRVGRDGVVFTMLKLRTMRGTPEASGEADVAWAAVQLGSDVESQQTVEGTAPEDRRTPMGRFLRKFSIDELPQLINVARGDMSLVGPRPERVAYVERFEQGVYGYRDRHRVKSGITGWAQVTGLRGKTSLADRVEWDNYYIENWSLWFDFKILLQTFLAVFKHRDTA
jgi:exopolysaccharide biosynthesis polyprenyl glycosylphosphotransferase